MIFFPRDTLCAQAFLAASSLRCNAKQSAKLAAVETKGENASHGENAWGKKRKKKKRGATRKG